MSPPEFNHIGTMVVLDRDRNIRIPVFFGVIDMYAGVVLDLISPTFVGGSIHVLHSALMDGQEMCDRVVPEEYEILKIKP